MCWSACLWLLIRLIYMLRKRSRLEVWCINISPWCAVISMLLQILSICSLVFHVTSNQPTIQKAYVCCLWRMYFHYCTFNLVHVCLFWKRGFPSTRLRRTWSFWSHLSIPRACTAKESKPLRALIYYYSRTKGFGDTAYYIYIYGFSYLVVH